MANINMTQGQLDNVVTAINNRAKTSTVELKTTAMSKAQFDALAEERKANRAGSGFDEWGKHHVTVATYSNINEGMYVYPSIPNIFNLGRQSSSGAGISKTEVPIISTNGYRQILKSIGTGSAYENTVTLPPAPNIYPYDTVLTAEQINSGVIKHADSSNSGLIVNGKFDTDTSGWTSYNSGTITFNSGSALISSNGTNYGGASQVIQTVNDKKYILEFEVSSSTGNRAVTITNSDKTGGVFQQANNGRFVIEFIATSTSCSIMFGGATSTTFSGIFDNIAVYPADAISRSDLVFLESWHEDISEKNIVYPLGNVQYLGGNTNGLTGIANGSFTGFETYSLFGKIVA